MTLIAVTATAAGLAALVNWYTRLPDRTAPRWLEWVSKPTVTTGLIISAALVDAADPVQQRWFVVGLMLCLCGDVALMWQPELFRTGLVSFLLGHVAFVAGFIVRGEGAPTWSVAAGAVVLLACLGIGVRHLLPTVRRTAPELFGPVLAYVAVIATMAVASWRGGHCAAPLGAAAFAVSDLTLADNKFAVKRRWSPLAVMVTYHLALALLVTSL